MTADNANLITLAAAMVFSFVPVLYTALYAIDHKYVAQRSVYREALMSHSTPRYDAMYQQFVAQYAKVSE